MLRILWTEHLINEEVLRIIKSKTIANNDKEKAEISGIIMRKDVLENLRLTEHVKCKRSRGKAVSNLLNNFEYMDQRKELQIQRRFIKEQ